MRYLLWHTVDTSAQARPEHPAFRFRGAELSYGALAERSSRLARTLVALGVCRGDRVGVMLTKGLDVPVALHGAMQAGAAFVPIDPGAPAARVRYILRDCGIRVLVSQPERRRLLAQVLAEPTPLEVVLGIDEPADMPVRTLGWPEVERAEAEPVAVAGTELDLAYVMYTSGSTGEPKGLMHTHASGLAYARLSASTYDVEPEDRLSCFAPLHVDQCTFAYFTGPFAGATSIVISEEHAAFTVDLARLIELERISIWYSVPLPLIQLADRVDLGEFDHGSLRWVTYGGEPFPPKHLRALMAHWPRARFSNVYGPAEANQCTFHHFGPGDVEDDSPVPIGDVWANTQALIVDERDAPVVDGEPGELLIRSPTVMHGYWRRADLDARAFHVLETHPNFRERYYRSGDLVRRRDDGLLEFLGRKDRQVKIRGYRVELDEVEAALVSHEAVTEAAAFAVGDSPENRRILAAVLLTPGADAPARDVARHAARMLAGYATPDHVVVEKSFPRTGGGKVDRRALAARLEAGSR